MNTESISQIMKEQREYFYSGKTLEISSRISKLKQLKAAVEDFEPKIMEALKKDLGKSEIEAYVAEIHEVIREIDYAVKNIKRWTSRKRVWTPMNLWPASSFIQPDPLGGVLVIGPWNYPFCLTLAPAVSSIAAGNTTIIKPSELAPNIEKVIHEMISQHFDPGFLCVVQGGIPETTELLKEKFDHIFFTGGGEVGKIVMTAAAKNLTPVTLELGGKSPCIIDNDIDLEVAVKRITWGKFFNAGQTCVAPDYVLITEKMKNRFLTAMKKTIEEFYTKEPEKSDDFGRIISHHHLERLKSYLKDGTVYTGGEFDDETKYMAPTILKDVSPDSPVMQEEIFGPILPVITYETISDAVDFVKKRPKPLALYVFSNNKSVTDRILRQTSSGGAGLNEVLLHISTNHLPFGGVGPSGMGSYHGKAGFEELSHFKSVLSKPFKLDLFLRYPKYKDYFKKIMRYV